MRRLMFVPALGMTVLLAACGQTIEQKAATGGLGGMAAGAAVGGPVGAAVGAGVGAAGGAYGEQAVEKVQEAQAETPTRAAASPRAADVSRDDIRQAQQVLKARGYYRGEIDGIVGPRTREAVAQYQRREGLPQTAQLDERTVDSLMQEEAGLPREGGAQRQQR